MKKHLLKINKMPTVDEFESSEWTDRKPYVGLVADNTGGGVFYNYEPSKLPDGYVWAKDSDFQWKTDFPWYGSWHYIGIDNKVALPHTIHGQEATSYKNMFRGTKVSGVYSDNPNVTDMGYMFSESQATNLDLTYLDTSNVTNMSGMFSNSKATSLKLSNFDTSKVINMSNMFELSKATILDLSSFDTSSVHNMFFVKGMFRGSQAKKGYARTQEDIDRFNNYQTEKPSELTFEVKSKTN